MRYLATISLFINLSILMACANGASSVPVQDSGVGCQEGELCDMDTPAFISTPAVGGRYYYVSTLGKDFGSGTREMPFKTISRAADVARAGDVVLIQAGIYYETVVPRYSGTPGKYIVYQKSGDGEVIIDAENGQRSTCIEINNKSFLQFIGLTVRGANSYENWPRAGISMTDGTSHIILDSITTYDNYVGIMAYGREGPVSFITVRNSKTFDFKNIGNIHYGIFFYKKVYDSAIINNHVAYTLPEDQSYGVEISTDFPGSQSDGARRISIVGNEIDHNESQGIHIWNAAEILIDSNHLYENGATGIQIEDGSKNIVIENNLSENNAQIYEFETGIWVDDAENVLVRNNVLRGNKIGLIITHSSRVIVHDNYLYFNNQGAENLDNAAGLIVEDGVSDISITHNTFYKNGASGMWRGAVNFGLFNPTCDKVAFKNNIVAETASILELFYDSCSRFVSDFNNFFNTRPLAFEWNQNQMDWPTYLTVGEQDAHSLTSEPLFKNPVVFDFSLLSASPLIGKGTVLARATHSGSGKTILVTDSSYFSDGFGIGRGDMVMIGTSLVSIEAIDYEGHSLTIDRDITWRWNDAVSFPFTGDAPNMGVTDIR